MPKRQLWPDSTADDALTPKQMRAMQFLDDSVRAGLVPAEQASTVLDPMIRRGQVAGARKRITAARMQALHEADGSEHGDPQARDQAAHPLDADKPR